MPITRIYADFNGLVAGVKNSDRTALVLDTFGSLRDLSNAGVILKEGMPLSAVDWSDDNEDLEGHGTAQYDWKRNRWVVEFDERGVQYVPAGDRTPVTDFFCAKCKHPFPFSNMLLNSAFSPGASCVACGTSVLARYAAPTRA